MQEQNKKTDLLDEENEQVGPLDDKNEQNVAFRWKLENLIKHAGN